MLAQGEHVHRVYGVPRTSIHPRVGTAVSGIQGAALWLGLGYGAIVLGGATPQHASSEHLLPVP